MKKTLNVEIDARVLRLLEEKGAADGRSASSYAAAVLGREVLGADYTDFEVIAPPGVGRGEILRSPDETDDQYRARRKAVGRLLALRGS